jgi:hypothetical protein
VWKGIIRREHKMSVGRCKRKTILGKLWQITKDNIKRDIWETGNQQ